MAQGKRISTDIPEDARLAIQALGAAASLGAHVQTHAAFVVVNSPLNEHPMFEGRRARR